MADRYWVGNTDTWNTVAGLKWSLTSGGVGGETVPVSTDDVYIEGSGTVTLYQYRDCNKINFSNFTGIFTSAGGSVACRGDVDLTGAWSLAGTVNWQPQGTVALTFNPGGKTLYSFGSNGGGNSGGILLAGDLNITNTDTYAFIPCASMSSKFDTGGYDINVAGTMRGSNSDGRVLTLNDSIITCLNFDWVALNTSCVINKGTSKIIQTGTSSFNSYSMELYDVELQASCSIGSSTYPNLTCHDFTVSNKNVNIGLYGNLTTSSLIMSGISIRDRALLYSLTSGTRRTVTASTSVSLSNVCFRDIAGAGAGVVPFTGTSLGDCGNNTNITFDPGKSVYWVGEGGNLNDAATHISDTDDGAPGASNWPLPQDTLIFNANSFKTASQTILVNTTSLNYFGSIDFSAVANSPTINLNGMSLCIHGSFILSASMTMSGTGTVILQGSRAETVVLNSAVTTMTVSHNLQCYKTLGTVLLANNLTCNRLTLTTGTLDHDITGNYIIQALGFTSNSGFVRTSQVRNGEIRVNGSGIPISFTNTNWTISPNAKLRMNQSSGGSHGAALDETTWDIYLSFSGSAYGQVTNMTSACNLTIDSTNSGYVYIGAYNAFEECNNLTITATGGTADSIVKFQNVGYLMAIGGDLVIDGSGSSNRIISCISWEHPNSKMTIAGNIDIKGKSDGSYAPSTVIDPTDTQTYVEGIWLTGPTMTDTYTFVYPSSTIALAEAYRYIDRFNTAHSTGSSTTNGYGITFASPPNTSNKAYNNTYLSGYYMYTTVAAPDGRYKQVICCYPKPGYEGRYITNVAPTYLEFRSDNWNGTYNPLTPSSRTIYRIEQAAGKTASFDYCLIEGLMATTIRFYPTNSKRRGYCPNWDFGFGQTNGNIYKGVVQY